MVAPLVAGFSVGAGAGSGAAAASPLVAGGNIISGAAAGLSILTGVGEFNALKEAAEAEEEALLLRQKVNTARTVREARKTARLARVRLSQLVNRAASSGIQGSSIEESGKSSISSTVASETGFAKSINFLESSIVREQLKASESRTEASLLSGARDLITSAGGLFG